MKRRQIGTFKEWLKEGKVNEQIEIQVDWWDQCVVEVTQELERQCNGCLDMDILTDFIKAKFAILGREWDEYIDNIYILHIKDLIFQFHGQSFCTDFSTENAELHTKAVVIEQLAQVIYDKVLEKTNSPFAKKDNLSISVADREPSVMVPMQPVPIISDEDVDYCDDLPFENRRVKKFKAYTKQLNEAAKKIEMDNLDACTAYCLDRIEKEAGSLDPDAVFDAAVKYAPSQVKSRMVLLYVVPMVQEFLTSSEIIVVSDGGDSAASKEMAKQAIEDLSYKMADDVLYALYKLNGGEEDAEIE